MTTTTLELRTLPGRLANDAVVATAKVAAGRLAGEQASVSLFPFMPGYPQDPRIDLNRQPQTGRPAGRSAGSSGASSGLAKRHAKWRAARTRCPGQ